MVRNRQVDCGILLAQIGDDAVIPRDYQLGGGSGVSAFTVTYLYGENSYAWFGYDAGIYWGC